MLDILLLSLFLLVTLVSFSLISQYQISSYRFVAADAAPKRRIHASSRLLRDAY